MVIEEAHKKGVKAGAEFCGIKNYDAIDMNYTNWVVHYSHENLSEEERKIQDWTHQSLVEHPFKSKNTIGLKDPIKTAIQKWFYFEGNQIVDEFDQ